MRAANTVPDKVLPIEANPASWRTIAKLFLATYLPLALILTGLVYGSLRMDADIQLRALQVQETGEVQVSARILSHDFGEIASDLLFLSKTPSLMRFIEHGRKEEKDRVTEQFLNLSQEKQRYDQIRYLDSSGMEVIRVNMADGKAIVVPGTALQHKGDRYYFRDSIDLPAGEVYVSPFDLNIENGKIEAPHKPMLRFGTPVFNSAGKRKGVVFFNYLGKALLADFQNSMREKQHAMLLNQDGYWLSSPDPTQEWGFMHGRKDRFATQYPAIWEQISQQEQGSIQTDEGLFTYTTVYPLLSSQHATRTSQPQGAGTRDSKRAYFWKIVSFVPAAEIPSSAFTRHPRTLAIYSASLVLLAALALYLAATMASRRQLRAAMVESEARLREITDTLGEGIYVIDEKGYITFVNPEAEHLLGWSRDEFMGQHAHDMFHYRKMDDTPAPSSECAIYQTNRTGQTYRGDSETFWRKDGSPLPVSVSASPIFRDGKVVGTVTAFSDITQRKQAEEALLRSEAQLQHAQQLAQMGSWELNLTSNSLVWSEEIYRIFEIDPAAFGASYEAFLNAIHPDDREQVNAAYSESLETHQPYRIEHRLLFPDGRIKFVLERGETVYDAEGRPLRSIGTVQDITGLKQAEEERFQAEANFHMVFDNAGDAILIHEIKGHFLEANQVASERLGYTRDELLRLSPSDINIPEQAEKCEERGDALLKHGRITFETVHVAKDGQRIPVEVIARLIDFEGKPATLSVVRDITQRKEAERALQQSETTARALLDATSESAMLLDASGTVLAINETGAARLHKRRDEIIGDDVFGLLPPALANSRLAAFQEVLHSGQPTHISDVRNDTHFETSLYPVFDAEGKVSQVALYAADVTEQVQLRAIDTLFHEIDQQVLRGLPIQELMQFVCGEAVRLFGYSLAWIGKKESDGSVSFSACAGQATEYYVELQRIGVRWDDTPQGHGPSGMTIKTGNMQVFKVTDPGFHAWHDAAKRANLCTIMGIPLIIRGDIYGAFTLYSAREDAFDDPATTQRLASIASRICVALETAMDQEQLRLLGTALSSAGNGVFITNQLGYIKWINSAFTRMTGYGAEETLGRKASILKSGTQDAAYYQQLWETVLQGNIWSNETEERRKDGMLFTVQQTITPIRDNEGKITHFISILEDITAQKETAAHIQYLAHHDTLTGLPNRSLFYDRLHQVLAQAKRNAQMSALMFIDLDHFKQVNDTLGHHVGDLLLQSVAQRIKDCVRESDTIARLGGDEFTVLLPQVEKQEDAAAVAEKIVAALTEPFLLDGHEVHSGGSIGIAIYPIDASDNETLIKCADTAMYAAKQQGRHTLCFFQQSAG